MSKDLYQKSYLVTINTDPKENYVFSEKNEFLETYFLQVSECCYSIESCKSGKAHMHMALRLHHKMRSDNLRRAIGSTMKIEKVDSISVNIKCIYNVQGLYNVYAYLSKELGNTIHKLGNVDIALYDKHCNEYDNVRNVQDRYHPIKKAPFCQMILVKAEEENMSIDGALMNLYSEGYYCVDLKISNIIYNFKWMKGEVCEADGLMGFDDFDKKLIN